MLPNEVFALACRAYYDEQGLIVDETNGEFAHCPLPKEMGEKGYYLLHEHHQQQGLLQSRDVGRRCFWVGDVKKWLLSCDHWPDNFFELWDIYEEFSAPAHDISHLHHGETNKKRLERLRKRFEQLTPEDWSLRVEKMNRATRKSVEVTLLSGEKKIFRSLADASNNLGFSVASFSNWANGKTKPSMLKSVAFV